MRELEDRRRCSHCGRDLCERPYLMSRTADGPVLSARTIAWIVCVTMLLLIVTWR
jgi:uncharacterized protein (DUF983 family)